jgi:hypothetical protein
MKKTLIGLGLSGMLAGALALAPLELPAQQGRPAQDCPTCESEKNSPRIFGAPFYDLWGIPVWPRPIHPHPGPAGGRPGEPGGPPPSGTPRGGGVLGGPLGPRTGGVELPPAPSGEGGGAIPAPLVRQPRKECCCVKCDNVRQDAQGWYHYDTVNLSIPASQDCSAWCRANGFSLGYEGRCREKVTQQEISAYLKTK